MGLNCQNADTAADTRIGIYNKIHHDAPAYLHACKYCRRHLLEVLEVLLGENHTADATAMGSQDLWE